MSTGLGACTAAGVYEVGRPQRVTAEEAADIDTRWRDFGANKSSCNDVGTAQSADGLLRHSTTVAVQCSEPLVRARLIFCHSRLVRPQIEMEPFACLPDAR